MLTLRKKMAVGFAVSAALVALLLVFGAIQVVEITRGIRSLELSDTIRSKTLQLRRHEKNYFLYGSPEELQGVTDYIAQIRAITTGGSGGRVALLGPRIESYDSTFSYVLVLKDGIVGALGALQKSDPAHALVLDYIAGTILDRPADSAELLRKTLHLPATHPIVRDCGVLAEEISSLRKTGEEMITISKEIDRTVRERVDRAMYHLRVGTIVFLPLFLLAGLGTSLLLAHGIVRRLDLLSREIDRTSKGFSIEIETGAIQDGADEVGRVLQKYRYLENRLADREYELLRSKQLSAIGTLASGIAHELNNPLNNIYTTAQRLMKKSRGEALPYLESGLGDIFTQSVRVKKIVSDLLEFARQQEPVRQRLDVHELIRRAWEYVRNTVEAAEIEFRTETAEGELFVSADPTQIEQVFINLFSNAVEAMDGLGTLTVRTSCEGGRIGVAVEDTGKGIPPEDIESIFEPFFSTKDRGTGLGLAVVYSIIQKHQGDIRVSSEPGRGAVFLLSLPRVPNEGEPPCH